ncbi:MAG: urea transporter, permease protein UrtC [Firmicutes bacterium]|nr:urea transporter, permease protein UrtC [Bacillota bacterium]
MQIGARNDVSHTLKWVCLALLLAIFFTLPLWAPEYFVMVFSLIFLYMALGQMWNLLAGYTGLVSLGQQIFIGLGGYSLAVITELYDLPMLLGLAVGGVASVLFALVISQPIFKMKGVYFTIGTWIAAEALAVFFSNWTYVRSGQGFNITASYDLTTIDIYYVAVVVGLSSVALVYFLLRSRLGLALMAMRDNEAAAETMGIELYKTKLKCFLLSAFVTGIAGGALYLSIAYIQPFAAFSIDWTVAMVFMVIIGGIGTLEGPIIGAIVYVVLKQFLYGYPGISMIILGVLAVAIILLAPKGIMGTLHDKYGFEILSSRRRSKDVEPTV